MDKYYIDLSVQNSSELLNNNYSVNLIQNNNHNNSNLNNNNEDLIEGFGNFGRVNLEKCCPLEYMWSEGQKKCVKVCDGCAIGAYGDINYDFLDSNGEFMSFAQCVGDATGAYDFDKINKRYGKDELLTQHDLNYHIDSDENASGVQPAEENPWAPVMGGMYGSSTEQQMNIRETGRWAGDDNTWNTYLSCDANGECSSASGSFTRITDVQRYDLQDGTTTPGEIREEEHQQNRIIICNASNTLQIINPTQVDSPYTLCNEGEPNLESWTSLCGLADFNNLEFGNLCEQEDITSLCEDEEDENTNNKLNINLICPDNR